MINKVQWANKLKSEIIELQGLQKILLIKNSNYPFLYPTMENVVYALANILAYLEDKNPYLRIFNEDYFFNRQITMHRTFLTDLHIGTEEGLRSIIKDKGFTVKASMYKQLIYILQGIKLKLPKTSLSLIKKGLSDIENLFGNRSIFGDYLNSVLNNVPGLSKEYKKACRTYFEGISIMRNKVSHSTGGSVVVFTNVEMKKLAKAKLKNAIDPNGGLQMTFEGYKFLVTDIIRFFDNIYANL